MIDNSRCRFDTTYRRAAETSRKPFRALHLVPQTNPQATGSQTLAKARFGPHES
jgi:hypothetical protein